MSSQHKVYRREFDQKQSITKYQKNMMNKQRKPIIVVKQKIGFSLHD